MITPSSRKVLQVICHHPHLSEKVVRLVFAILPGHYIRSASHVMSLQMSTSPTTMNEADSRLKLR